MAARGRCGGCGKTGTPKAIARHIVDCEPYQELYARNPTRALDPEAEYARWEAEDKQAARQAAHAGVVTANAQRKADQAGRFARLPDPDLD
jgi:hypothetical protein